VIELERSVFAKLPRKWSRRLFAVYLAVTIFGGIILVLFLILLGLWYSMSAPAPLPDPNLLIHPKATAWLVIRANGLQELPAGTLQFLTGGTPPQIEHLIALASHGRPCPIQIVLSAFPGEHGPEKCMAVSLGRFPGAFRVVRRDLERAVENRNLPLSLRYRQSKAIFSADEPPNPLNTLSLAECTLLRCANTAAAETLIDRLERKADLSADRWPRALPALPPGSRDGFEGWAGTWQEIPLKNFFPAESAANAHWQSVIESLSTQFPALARSRDLHFAGTFPDRTHAELEVTVQIEKPDAAALAEKLNACFRSMKLAGHAQAGVSGDSIELVKLQVSFAGG
jgi:hypothetical protein